MRIARVVNVINIFRRSRWRKAARTFKNTEVYRQSNLPPGETGGGMVDVLTSRPSAQAASAPAGGPPPPGPPRFRAEFFAGAGGGGGGAPPPQKRAPPPPRSPPPRRPRGPP